MKELILGLFGGAGATLLWELFLRPMRDRRNVAEMLSAEVSLNLQVLAATQEIASPDKVPADFELSTMAFDAVAEKVGELSPQTLAEVLFLYRYFKQLSAMPKTYVQYVDDLRSTPQDAPYSKTMENELRQCVLIFNSYVEKAIARVNLTQPFLLKDAFPWWSPRRFRRQPSRSLDSSELQDRLRASQEERAKLDEKVRRRSQDPRKP